VLKSSPSTDTLIFRRQTLPPPLASWFSMGFKSADRVRLFGAEPEVIEALGVLLKSLEAWKSEEWKDRKFEEYDFNLTGLARG